MEESSSDVGAVAGIKSRHVNEHSLETYCCMVRFLYTSEISIEVDLYDFAIGCTPNKPFTASCKKRPSIERLFLATESPT